jgi:hypothetical protein
MLAIENGTKLNSSGRKTNGDSTWGTRGKGFGMPHHAPIHVTPVVVFCGILWRRHHNPIGSRLFTP